jgi:hypothetical protein
MGSKKEIIGTFTTDEKQDYIANVNSLSKNYKHVEYCEYRSKLSSQFKVFEISLFCCRIALKNNKKPILKTEPLDSITIDVKT